MTTPIQTANGKYQYDQKFYGFTLDEWIQAAHRENCLANNWATRPLNSGAFGYDNLALSLTKVFQEVDKNPGLLEPTTSNKEKLAELIHQGWCENYIFWRDNKPWTKKFTTEFKYRRPSQTLGDDRRNECSTQSFEELPEDEKNKDLVFVDFLLNNLTPN